MKRLYIISIALIATLTIFAQGIVVNAPSRVAVGEQFRLSYTIATKDVSNFRCGNVPDGLEVLIGPSVSQQTSIQMIQGHTTSSSINTYTYILYPQKPGTYTIAGARARVNGKDVTSSPVKITVTGSASSPSHQSSPQSQFQQNPGANIRSAGSRVSDNDVFIRVTADKHRVHEQEPVLLTYKVYTQVELSQLDIKMPDINGVHTQNIEIPQKTAKLEMVNGRQYRTILWSQYVLFPQKSGKIEIPDVTYSGTVIQECLNVDPLEAFLNGGSNYIEKKKEILAKGMTIQVDPLPAQPADFSGGVGTFSISGQLVQNSVKTNDVVTLRLVVSGNGNLKLIKQPEVQWPKDFDKYNPEITDKTHLTTNGIEGNMVFDCMAAPRNAGEYEIPAVSFTYYDTKTGTYKTITTGPFKLSVTQGAPDAGKKDYAATQVDIHDIKRGDASTLSSDTFFGSILYWIIILVTFLAFLALIIIFRKRALDRADVVKMRGKKANKVAVKRLKKAAKLMKMNRQDEFYDEVLRALWGYVGDKLNIPVSELSRENITDQLLSRNVDDLSISTFVNAIDECEYARYAPGEAQGKMNIVYEKAIRGITDIDNFLRGKHQRKASAAAPLATKAIVILLVFLSMAMPSLAQQKADADSAYAKGNYVKAIADYKALLKKTPSAEIYYNLGNAYYRSDSLAQAILSYERAHRIAPSDNEISENLQFARTKTIDKMQPQSEIFIVVWWQALADMFSPSAWGVIAILSLILVVALLLLFLFAESVLLRQLGFFGGVTLFLLFIVSNLLAFTQTSRLESEEAIVIVPSCAVKKTPTQKSADESVIHEATHVTITDDSVNGWFEVELDDGHTGWVEKGSVEKI